MDTEGVGGIPRSPSGRSGRSLSSSRFVWSFIHVARTLTTVLRGLAPLLPQIEASKPVLQLELRSGIRKCPLRVR